MPSPSAALATLALKWVAYGWTGSLGLLADAVESIVNLVAALTAFASLWYASRPVDPSHTYGHEKIEYFSTGLEGVLILVASGSIVWYAVGRLLVPRQLQSIDAGVAIALGWPRSSILERLAIYWCMPGGRLHRVGSRGQTPPDDRRRHVRRRLDWNWALARLTSLNWIDPVVALLVGINITRTGVGLIHRSFDGLMDRSLPQAEQDVVRAAIESKLGDHMDYHAMRTRRAGSRRFVDFHLLVPGALTVQKAHAFASGIEEAIRAAAPNMEVTVHIEPIEDEAAWEDSQLLPHERAAGLIRSAGPDHHSGSGAG